MTAATATACRRRGPSRWRPPDERTSTTSTAPAWLGVTSITKVLDAGVDVLEDEPGRPGGDRGRRRLVEIATRLARRTAVKTTTLSTTAMDRGRIRAASPDPPARARGDRPRDGAAVSGARAWLNAQVRGAGCGRSERRSASTRLSARGTWASLAELTASLASDWKTGPRLPPPTAPCTATTGSNWRRTRTRSSSSGREAAPSRRSPAPGSSTPPPAAPACTRRQSRPGLIAFRACPRPPRLGEGEGGVTSVLAIDPGRPSPPGCGSTAPAVGSGSRSTTCSSAPGRGAARSRRDREGRVLRQAGSGPRCSTPSSGRAGSRGRPPRPVVLLRGGR
jgi:hypothetical protein